MGDWGGQQQGGGYQGGGGGGGSWGGGGGYQQQGGGGGSNSYGGSWGGGGGRGGGGGGNVRPGDWQCPAGCGNVFASKMNCFRCGQPRPENAEVAAGDQYSGGGGGYDRGGGGSWGGGGGGWNSGGGGGRQGGYNDRPRGPTPRPGDWNCPAGCGLVFASKPNCFRCGVAKPEGADQEYGERQDDGYQQQGGGDWNAPRSEYPPVDGSVQDPPQA